ncbi:hypothetical protein V1527DRAFT_204757 [Lipomyces starkeyi]
MASASGSIDSAQKSLIENLTTILKLSNGLISIPLPYGNYTSEVISRALALLQYSYNPILFSNDLWTHLTNDGRKIDELSNILPLSVLHFVEYWLLRLSLQKRI